ncbi:hypothetical protein COJ96_11785 [Bacillus sp. AFS073361]|nr:hypothetical protein COJ96_11785 [Bacillus sp. AFS073361]
MYIEEAYEANISGEIPLNCSKKGKIQRFESFRRKNFPYYRENMGIWQYKRKFSAYFSNTVKSTFRYNRAKYKKTTFKKWLLFKGGCY